jgi:enoyl-CoA hydratase/carnithine racemase
MPPETTGTVTVERDGAVAIIRLQREAKLNALSSHMERALLDVLGSDAVLSSRAVVITGSDSVFSAGADVTEMREMTPATIADYYRTTGMAYERFAELAMPTVAAITGYCLGGGLELALAADFRVADDAAEFGFPEVGIGILPSSGGIARLVTNVGPARTRDLVLRGRRFSARDAERWGLITEVAEPGEQLARALAIAAEVTSASALAVELTKRVIDAAAESSTRTTLLMEQLAYAALNRAE